MSKPPRATREATPKATRNRRVSGRTGSAARLLCCATLALALLGCRSWETEHRVSIAAPPEKVWRILTDLESYPQWNSYSPRAEGELRMGGVVQIDARLGDRVEVVDNRITELEANRTLCWQSLNWYGFLSRGTRCRFLEPGPGASTDFRHHEVMEGPLAWLIERIFRERIDAGLERMNRDLKRAAESRSGS